MVDGAAAPAAPPSSYAYAVPDMLGKSSILLSMLLSLANDYLDHIFVMT